MHTRILLIFCAWLISGGLASAQITPGSLTIGSDYRFGRLGGIAADGSGSLFVTEIDGT
jgi:hypothetical protein